MNWLEVAVKMVEQDDQRIKYVPLSRIIGGYINHEEGYGILNIKVPADIADDLTKGGRRKYIGGLLLLEREPYERLKGGVQE